MASEIVGTLRLASLKRGDHRKSTYCESYIHLCNSLCLSFIATLHFILLWSLFDFLISYNPRSRVAVPQTSALYLRR